MSIRWANKLQGQLLAGRADSPNEWKLQEQVYAR